MKSRIAYLDYIKVFLIFMVVAHHAAQSYGETGGAWLVFDSHKVDILGDFMFINASYLMALYFFISGYFTFKSLKNKTFDAFFRDRIKRLGIPLLFVSLLIFIPLHYLLSDRSQNYLEFALDLYLYKPPLAVGHLWFVISLFAYSMLLAFFVKNIFTGSKMIKFKPYYPLIWIVVVSVLNILMRKTFPIDHWETWMIPLEPAHLPNYLLAFVSGYYACQNNWLEQLNKKMALFYFGFFLVSFFISFQFNESHFRYYFMILVENTLCVGLSIALMVSFKYIKADSKGFLQLLSENTYGIYLVHLFVVLAYQQIFLSIETSGMLKFLAVSFLSFFTSFLISVLLRKIPAVSKVI